MTLREINLAGRSEFVAALGAVFEHSPRIAEATWKKRPFASQEDLHLARCAPVEAAGEGPLLDLIRAHPDLVGRLAQAGALTAESNHEQSAAGLLSLDLETRARFEHDNTAYRERFGFPFILCARLNSTDTILDAFSHRLENPRETELQTAWTEIRKIAALRLADMSKICEKIPVQFAGGIH